MKKRFSGMMTCVHNPINNHTIIWANTGVS